MQTCSDTCMTDCDFCRYFRDFYDVDEQHELLKTGFGLCLVRQEIVGFDWGCCGEFYCMIAWRKDNSVVMEAEKSLIEPESRKTSRRDLKGFAGGIAHQFACSAQHYAWLAHHLGIPSVTIDLLTLHIQPEQFDIERNRILAGYCRNTFLRNVVRLIPPAAVTHAILIADFGIHDYQISDYFGGSIGSTIYTVILTDDRGKEWSGTVIDERVLAQGEDPE